MLSKYNTITQQIIGCAFKVHNQLGPGFLEKIYENALVIELTKAGLQALPQHPIQVFYDNQIIGNYFADIVIENEIIIEVKAIEKLNPLHEVQLVNYLSATGLELGLLINFGRSVDIKRKYKDYYKP